MTPVQELNALFRDEMRAYISFYQSMCEQAIRERNEWRDKALALESQIAELVRRTA